MKIRQILGDERLTTSFPLQAYAFGPSPSDSSAAEFGRALPYHDGNHTLVVEDGATTLATASAIPMWQNLRGTVLPMAGVAWVATHPMARRLGHSHALMVRLLGEMREAGHVISALYPFRTSFYQRLGYASLPMARTVTFPVADLEPLLGVDLPGEVDWQPMDTGYDAFRQFNRRLLGERHGFALFPEHHAAGLRDRRDRWVVTATVDEEVVGAVTYRIAGQGGDLRADDLLTSGPRGRALLLRFFAHHIDQVSNVVLTAAPDELPELWAPDLRVRTEAEVSFPGAPPPMARVLAVEGLRGIAVGPGRVSVDLVDDPFIAGRYLFEGSGGRLEVTRTDVTPGRGSSQASGPSATLTSAGLAALVFGALDPLDLAAQRLGSASTEAAAELRSLLPRDTPYLFPPR
ncbi:GNAT family N-acetyltransferase [Micromonospora sp. CPCC 205371]|nr:GNAT family N-acetyltransferase [Micromonospora sp. CPCC 205371]